jgi:hypothetical protein
MTQDFIKNVLTGLDTLVHKLVVTELKDDTRVRPGDRGQYHRIAYRCRFPADPTIAEPERDR